MKEIDIDEKRRTARIQAETAARQKEKILQQRN